MGSLNKQNHSRISLIKSPLLKLYKRLIKPSCFIDLKAIDREGAREAY